MITIVPYDTAWATAFEREARALSAALGSLALRIEHVGSTSVAGLAAKPVIDIQVSVARLSPLEPYAGVLQGLGYRFIPLGDFDAFYPFFAKPGNGPAHTTCTCASRAASRKASTWRSATSCAIIPTPRRPTPS